MPLRFDSIIFKNNDENVLDSLSFGIKDKEVLAIYSESKEALSALNSLLSRNADQESGSIFVDEIELNDDTNISILTSKSQLFAHLTLRNNFMSFLRNKDVGDKELAIEKTAKKLQIESMLDKKVDEITNGQYVRAVVCKALLTSPKALILYDFSLQYDGLTRTNFWKEVRPIAKSFSIPILLLTTSPSEAMIAGDKVGLLLYGKLMAYDTPINIYKNPETVDAALSFSNPPLSLFKGEYHDGNIFLDKFEINVPNFKKRHDDYYKNALKNMPSDDILNEPYNRALRDKHALLIAFRITDFKLDEDGEIIGKTIKKEEYGTKTILHIEIDGNEFLLYSNNDVEIGKEVRLSLANEPDLIFDPLTKRKI